MRGKGGTRKPKIYYIKYNFMMTFTFIFEIIIIKNDKMTITAKIILINENYIEKSKD